MNNIYSTSGTVSSQNQITLPKAVRDALNIQAGDVVGWLIDQGRVVLTPLSRKKTDPVELLRGSAGDAYVKYGGAKGVIKKNIEDWDE